VDLHNGEMKARKIFSFSFVTTVNVIFNFRFSLCNQRNAVIFNQFTLKFET